MGKERPCVKLGGIMFKKNEFDDEFVLKEFVGCVSESYEPPNLISKIHKIGVSVSDIQRFNILVAEVQNASGAQRLDIRMPGISDGEKIMAVDPVITAAVITAGATIAGAIISRPKA